MKLYYRSVTLKSTWSKLFTLTGTRSTQWLNRQEPTQRNNYDHPQDSRFRSQKDQFDLSLSFCSCHKTLVCSFVLSWLDDCSSLSAGSPKYFLKKLHKIQNNAARVIFRSLKLDHGDPTSACTLLASSPSMNQLQTLFHLLSLAPALKPLLTFSRFMFLPDSFVPPLTLVRLKSLLSIQSQLANLLLHTKTLQSETNSHTSGMLPLSMLSKLL